MENDRIIKELDLKIKIASIEYYRQKSPSKPSQEEKLAAAGVA